MKCKHHFVIAEPPLDPLGTCKKCGSTKMHTNIIEVARYSGWRNYKGRNPNGKAHKKTNSQVKKEGYTFD